MLFLLAPLSAADAVEWPDDRAKALPCRPTVSCTAELAAPGVLELETGAIYTSVTGTRALAVPFLVKQTVASFLQLQAGSNGYTVTHGPSPMSYFDNAVFGPKVHLFDQGDARPAFALSALASVPTSPAAHTRSSAA
jgi:hypothetical protein